ncbi:MAG: hypothetical protein ACRCXC_12645 [Legionella sp.]
MHFGTKNLNPTQHPEITQVAQHALSEAQLELNFTRDQGFFSGLFKHIKRCWTYGWTGFFKPNLPTYVVSESLNTEAASRKPREKIKKSISIHESEKDLPALLNDIADETDTLCTQEQFENIIKALALYSLEMKPKEELATRQKLHNLYHYVLNDKGKNASLYRWLKDNQNPFIINQFRLVELILKEKSHDDMGLLFAQINEDSDQLQYIADEFNCTMPELIIADLPNPTHSATTEFVENTTKVLAEYMTGATELAQNAWSWAVGVADGFFKKMQTAPHDEEEGFEVEHVESFRASNTQQ